MTKEEKKEYRKQWYQKNREKILKNTKQYYENNKEKKLKYAKEYRNKNRNKIIEYLKQYRQNNKDYFLQYNKDNKEMYAKKYAEYVKTPFGRAAHLISAYNQADINRNRGECTLTPEWIIENIFASKCHYCGETDWRKLGCDRIDNSKPHTPDNVVPCCWDCNNKRGRKDYEQFLLEINN